MKESKAFKYTLITLFIYILSFGTMLEAAVPARKVPLPVSDVVKVATFDEKGYLWIGTTAGLLRYDGYDFAQYRNTLAHPLMLSSSGIQSLAADGHGHLWVGTDDGVTCLDLETYTTKIYRMPRADRRIVYIIYVDNDGTVWAGTDHGLLRLETNSDKFVSVKGTEQLNVKAIADNGHGILMVGTWDRGLWKIDKKGLRVKKANVDGRNFYCLRFDKSGSLWAGSWQEGLKYITAPESDHPQVKSLGGTNSEPIYNIEFENDGHVLACSRSEVYKFDPQQNMTIEQKDDGDMNACVTSNGFGTIVLMKKTDGMELFSMYTTPLSVIDVAPYDDGMIRGGIDGLLTLDGNLFWLFSKTSGISTFNMALNKSLHYPSIAALSSLGKDLKYSSCEPSMVDSHGNIWIGNNFFGLIVVRHDGSTTWFDQGNTPLLRENGIYSMTEDNKGRLWFGQTNNVFVVLPNGKFINIPLAKYIKGYGKDEVTRIFEDHRGRIWICTRGNGLLRIDAISADGRSIKAEAMNRSNGRYIAAGAISCVEDKQGNIFLITSSGELLKWDNDNDKSLNESVADNINDDRLYSAIVDENGVIWLAATNYIIRLQYDANGNQDVRRFYTPGRGRGLTFEENSVFRRGQMLYFGARDRIVAIDTRRIGMKNSARVRLALTGISVDGRTYDELDSTLRTGISSVVPVYTTKIVKPHSIRRIDLSFANLDFANEGAGRYSYKLDGYNKDWVIVQQGSHSATFENLPSGTYKFHLRCTDANGQWTEMPYTVELRVLPPWWATWWAYIIYIVLLGAAVYGVIVWYRQRLRTQNKLQIARVFTNITHELLTPIAVVSASIETEREHVGEGAYTVIQNNMTRLTRLIREILEVDKLNSGKVVLQVSDNNMTEFLSQEVDNVRPLAKQKDISISFEEKGNRPAHCWFDTDKLDKIIYNLISNAIKYTQEGGAIRVSVDYSESGKAVIKVSDNGIGISKDKLHNLYSRFMDGNYRQMRTMGTGIGLSLTHDLVALHHGTIKCESEEGKGTTFTVAIKTSKAIYPTASPGPSKGGELKNTSVAENLLTENSIAEHISISPPLEGSGEAPGGPGEAPGEVYTILLVEDNTDLLLIMESFLSKYYHILRATNGKSALNVLARNAVDIVVSDVMMPIMDGIELTKEIKGNNDYAMLPVILLTAKVRNEDRNEGYIVGADDYLTKPFSMETLKLRIDNIIANRERIRSKFASEENFNPEQEHYSDPDKQFLERCVAKVKENLDHEGYDREAFAADMCMSSSSLYKKLRALTGEGVTGFINSIRLKEACRIMRAEPDITINDLYVRVGYNSPTYFRRLFKQEFGVTPSEFLEKLSN